MKFLARLLILIVLIPVLAVVTLLVYGTVTDYQPADKTLVYTASENKTAELDSVVHLMTWNIGYSGLGDDMDFFYDGGEQVRSSFGRVLQNLADNKAFVAANDSIDFILLQEVDRDSKRSYYTDQLDSLQAVLPNFESYFATNYKVGLVPQPITNPYGKVFSGLASFSKHTAREVSRNSFKGNYPWPMGVFMLDRCYMPQYYPLANGKELVVVNTHNSAYDDGTLKEMQNKQLKTFLTKEYEKGNFVIVGGDWNQYPPHYEPTFENKVEAAFRPKAIEGEFLQDWKFAFDSSVPTNRDLTKPYNIDHTHRKVIDFFLVSPNVEVLAVKGVGLGFKSSDHNPVILSVRLK